MTAPPQPPPGRPGRPGAPVRPGAGDVRPGPGTGADEEVRTFTRITVVGPRRSVDVAVPDDLAVAELVAAVVEEMGESGEARWLLEHPVRGLAHRNATPATLGLRDGERLSLRREGGTRAPVTVDEVAEAVAEEIDSRTTWSPRHSRLLGTGLLGGWPVVAAGVGSLALPPAERPFVAAVAVLVLLATVLAARSVPDPAVPGILALALLVGSAFAGWLAVGGVEACLVGAAVGLLGGIVVAAVVAAFVLPAEAGRLRPVAISASLPLLGGLASLGLAAAGLDVPRRLAVVALLALVLLAVATTTTLSTSGVGDLDARAASGEDVGRGEVARRVALARGDLGALLLGIAVTGGVAATALTRHGRWGAFFGALALLVVALRARGYTWPPHVLALVVPAATGLGVAALVAAARGGDNLLAPVLLGGAAPLALVALHRARAVDVSRLRLWADRIEVLLVVGVVPAALAVFEVYGAVYQRFR